MPLQQIQNVPDALALLDQDPCCTGEARADAERWRLKHLAGRIDSLQRSNRTVRCLALGCGHLCEAELSEAVRERKAMIFAVDQDSRSLRVVSKNCAHLDVDPIRASVRDILTGKAKFGHIDLAYTAGLYDGLPKSVARSLTAKLFSMLDTGGIVIVPMIGSRHELIELGADVPKDEIASQRYYEDPFRVIGYLELVRKS
jgi:hypothetical protein